MEGQQCNLCLDDQFDHDELQCDRCDKWYHLECVKEDESIFTSGREWTCPKCLPAQYAEKPTPLQNGAEASTDARIPPSRVSAPSSFRRPNGSPEQPLHPDAKDSTHPTLDEISRCFRSILQERSLIAWRDSENRRLEEAVEAVLLRKEKENTREISARNLRHPSSTTYGYQDDYHELSRSQMSARQAVSGKLPTFSGNPDEWPMFEATFEETTRLCGFSDGENIVRLQQALKGRALRAVQCRLRRAEHLDNAMTTLRKMFGRPEVVVKTLLEQIRHQTPPRPDKLDTLVDFALSVEEVCATVESSGLKNRFDGPLLQELVCHLPPMLQLQWGLSCVNDTVPDVSLARFCKWMEKVKDASLLVSSTVFGSGDKPRQGKFVNLHSAEQYSIPTDQRTCMCEENCSQILNCENYWKATVFDRWGFVRSQSRCKGCLRRHQGTCRIRRVCGRDGCTAQHHPSLHRPAPTAVAEDRSVQPNNVLGMTEANLSHSTATGTNVLLRYIPVTLHSGQRRVNTLALLDEGSTVTLMEHGLLVDLGMRGTAQPLCLNWTGGQHRNENDSVVVNVRVSGVDERSTVYELKAVRTVRNLGLPEQQINVAELSSRYKHINAVPVASFGPAAPRIIIGMDNYRVTRPLKTIEGSLEEPVATKTRLGWTISGRFCAWKSHDGGTIVAFHQLQLCECNDIEARVDAALKGSFGLEEATNQVKVLRSKADERAMAVMKTTTTYEQGRFTTGLLWRADDIKLPNNRFMALKRLDCLERKMNKEPLLRDVMNDKLKEYLKKGYIRLLTNDEKKAECPRKWFLPIFPVFNPNKPGKLRIVWDAAASVHGISLNSTLLTGPDLLIPLPSVLQRFRECKIAVAADVSEMYHQVCIRPDDIQSQRFLWKWDAEQKEPEEYVMLRMTFGATCSPSCAQFVKNVNADQFSDRYPLAVRSIKEDHHVDDLLTSVEDAATAVQLAQDIRYIQAEAGFPLHHWLSNSIDVLKAIGETTQQHKDLSLEVTSPAHKILGMWWDPANDVFRFKIPKPEQDLLNKTIPTKRQVLSTLMSMYDPLGLIAGLLFYLKIILQDIWRAGIAWDEPIPRHLYEKWNKWLMCLSELEHVSIPRCYRQRVGIDGTTIQLHIFVDAGKDGYSAVSYFRFERNGLVETALVGGKTRVTPLKYVSIPRLELQAAVLGVRLASTILKAHRLKVASSHFWTDSRDVICWLRSDHRRYSTFVAHRIGEILEHSNIEDWRCVPTQFNVADDGTKWTNLDNHLKTSRWFTGPDFLLLSESSWPIHLAPTHRTEEELRQNVNVHETTEQLFDCNRFGRWDRMRRAVGYVWRYVLNLQRTKKNRQFGPLTSEEIQRAETSILRDVQRHLFPNEYRQLERERAGEILKWSRNTPLLKRSAYLDADGILRVKGRIDACRYVGDDTKKPIILPKAGRITDLIVGYYHRRYRHANHQTVMNEIRQRYDIPALRTACHRVRTNCQFCIIRSAIPRVPMMGDLPEARISPFARPFTFTGVDYFGPFTTINGRRTEKRWGVLFTCLTVRAVHIEVAHSLTTSSCIIALRNFIARRGTPNEIISDRGTNFIGAERELREALKEVDNNQIIEEMNLPNTKWTFNPPAAPHFGGAWERLVQSVKRGLYQIQFTRTPSDPVLSNWLIEVEAIINTRPLTDVPVDSEEESPITPNHFILGSSGGAKPTVICDDSGATLRNSWKTSQVYANEFWRRWIKTYLPTLTKRSKWFAPQEPLRVDDIVVIVDENLPRSCWPKGRIVLTETSEDGAVRRAHVQTATGRIMERPAVKLARLNITPKQSLTAQTPGGVSTKI